MRPTPRCDDHRSAVTAPPGAGEAYDALMQIIVFLLVLWLLVSVLGFVIKGLLWLAIIGVVLFVLTGALGVRRGR